MNVLLKTLSFSLALILIFTGVTYVLPQMEGAAPEETEVDLANLNIESFVAMGAELFHGKGTCALCHNQLGRAPDLLALNVTRVTLERMADSRYQGDARDAASYLRESMLQPGIYVVAGFGKKGSNDTESPMPAIDKPPIQLSAVEIDAIIAYLQSKDGNPVTVALPATPARSSDESAPPIAALAQSPEELIAKFACAACHSILDSEGLVGPDLRDVGQRLGIGQIRQSIVTPRAIIAEGYVPVMPDFPSMTLQELEMLVGFLAKQTGEQS